MKIFVSSTSKDLADARREVCERLLQLDIQPVSMDCYTADTRPPKILDDSKVSQCDAFVIIVGHLYGSCPPKQKKSFTELEYDAALTYDKPVYTFLASEQFTYNPEFREKDAANAKIKAFRDRLAKNHSPRPFDNADNLCVEVIIALAPVAKSEGKLLVPLLPLSYLAHPYPMQENFTGRLKERAMLTEWVRAQNNHPILSLVGMGGLGKSALTWFWLHEDLPHENLKFSGILWWSFYEQEASFESFISHALLYANNGTITPEQLQSDYDRMQALWCILRETPFLIVLDGAERLLRAYHALDAAYKGDNFSSEAGDKHLLCADPRTGTFLQWLTTSGTKTKTLITTRLHPKELNNLAGCRREDLNRLEPDDAVEFMRRQSIQGPRTAIIHACEPYDFHPLCLRLLSSAIREDPQKPGDITATESWHQPAELVNKEHHILQVVYDTMAKDHCDLLSRIAAMRGPVDYDTAKVLSTYKNEDELKGALRELVVRGLLSRQKDSPHYDLHPIVRQYAYNRLGDKTAAHIALKDYFATIPEPDKIETLDDLQPTIELFHHTVSSGAYEEAIRIYRDRLHKSLYYQFGAYDIAISLLRVFFQDGEDKLPCLKGESEQAWLLSSLAITYTRTGQCRKTVGLLKRNFNIRNKQGKDSNIARALYNLAGTQLLLGELKQTEANIYQQIDITSEINDDYLQAAGHLRLGDILSHTGRYEQADKELQQSLSMFAKQENEQAQCIGWSYQALRSILMKDPQTALQALDKARSFWELFSIHKMPMERDLVQILWLSGATKRQIPNLADAEVDLNEALSRCRRIRLVELEADILLELAKLNWQKSAGKNKQLMAQVKNLTREALEIADRCEYRLKQADIHNFLAEMALAKGDKTTARKHAEIAKERAYCDGPPYAYQKALDIANGFLTRLASS